MKSTIIILTFLLLVILVPSVQGDERVINGGFETGDFTGWSQTGMMYQPWYPIFGSHSVDWYDSTGSCWQTIDLTDVDTFTFYNDIIQMSPPRPDIKVYIDGNLIYTQNLNVVKVWRHDVNVSSYSGDHIVKIECVRYTTIWINLDGVTALTVANSLSGNVTSLSTGLPIAGASVTVHDDYGAKGSITAISNETGYYRISGITDDIWRIQAAAFDYDEWHENDLSITSDMTRDIEMVYNPTPTEDPTVPIIIAIPPSTPDSDNGDEDESPDDDDDGTIIDEIIDNIEESIDNINEGIDEFTNLISESTSQLMEPLEDLMEPITEPIQSVYEEITHTTETSSFFFILFAYFGALVASLIMFYTSETEIDIPTILLSGTIGWILPLIITFSGIISLVFASGIMTGLVFAIFGFVIYVVMNNISSEEML